MCFANENSSSAKMQTNPNKFIWILSAIYLAQDIVHMLNNLTPLATLHQDKKAPAIRVFVLVKGVKRAFEAKKVVVLPLLIKD